jgi:molecular chaperone GrpE
MSLSDEAVPAEEVTPEEPRGSGSGQVTDKTSADGGVVEEAEVVVEGEVVEGDVVEGEVVDGEIVVEGEEKEEEERDPMVILAGERDEYLLALQRTQADFENYRKRIQRMQEEQSARAASALVTKLLPALDTLDLAQAHQSEADAESDDAKALSAARAMLLDALGKEGLERVDEPAVPFDPSVHDAVARTERTEGEGGEGEGGGEVIDQILRSGYRWRGQVLRPAMVSVRG